MNSMSIRQDRKLTEPLLHTASKGIVEQNTSCTSMHEHAYIRISGTASKWKES